MHFHQLKCVKWATAIVIGDFVPAGQPIIAWVMNGEHFVLVIGWDASDNDTLLVNDPGFNRASYRYCYGCNLAVLLCNSGDGHV